MGAEKGKHKIETPQGSVFQVDGKYKVKIEWNPGFGPEYTKTFNDAQATLDSECMRYMEPYMQLDTGMMIASMKVSTVIGSGTIVVDTPYARKMNYSPSKPGRASGPLRGPHYFDRMVADKKEILRKLIAKVTGGK